jgi:Type VI secretion system/phage-baseplate injector OB domain
MADLKYFGKYRGVVTDNRDPEQMGRIRAKVPDVSGDADTSWATPCVPLPLTDDVGSALPAVGANVWIEFEQGEPDYPIWSGCYFTSRAETPRSLQNAP